MGIAPVVFSVKKGCERFEFLDQIRVRPAPKSCGRSGDLLRCLSARRRGAVITDVDLAANVVDRIAGDLPVIHQMWFHNSGWCLGYTKRARLGNPTELFFLNHEAKLMRQAGLPDAASDIAQAPGAWYVSCRDGRVYAFELDGTRLWRWRVPGCRSARRSFAFAGNVTAPAALIAASYAGVIVAERDRLYRLNIYGKECWRSVLPAPTDRNEIIPCEAPVRRSALDKLGLVSDPGEDVLAVGFVRMKLDSPGVLAPPHPFNSEIKVVDWRTKPSAGDEVRIELVLGDGVVGSRVSTVAVSHDGIAVGTNTSELHLFGTDGSLLRTFMLGVNGPVSGILLESDDRLAAAYCGSVLTAFRDGRISGYVKVPGYNAEMAAYGEHMLLWNWKTVWLIDRQARVLWKAEFSKPIGGVVPDELGFTVLAGGLFRFRQTVPL